MLKLQFRDRRREAVWLVDQVFTIGKSPSNSLMINDETVLDFHAEITNTSGQLSISNKSSSPSLWVNNNLVENLTKLNAEDVIKLGHIELELVDPKTLLNRPKKSSNNDVNNSWSIHSQASWLAQTTFPITEKVTIGRDPACDITLPLEHLSRKHLELEVRSGHLFIKDLGSSNGTFLNGNKITESEIMPGDKIKLDVLTFDVSGPAHDPNKTIIRPIPTPSALQPQKQQAIKKANKEETTPKAKPIKKQRSSQFIPANKRLVSKGKQHWISEKNSGETSNQGKSGLIFFAGSVILIGLIGVYFVVNPAL